MKIGSLSMSSSQVSKNPKSEALSETLARELSLTEEEISFLRNTDQTNLKLPRLLFIFDGYDEIEDIHAFHSLHSLESKEEFLKHNFFERNKIHEESWKNAKFIITCREEHLQKVQRKELLFGPLDGDSAELAIKPGSCFESTIKPFLDEQITSCLKKYCYFKQLDLHPAELSQESKLGASVSSWFQVQKFEKVIDNYHLREIARMPFMLWVICEVLPKMTSENFEKLGKDGSTQVKTLVMRFLLEYFVSQTTKTNLKRTAETTDSSANQKECKSDLEEEEKENQIVDPYIEAINRQAQNFALRSGGYTVNEIKTQGEVIDGSSLTLKLHPLAQWDSNQSRAKFQYPWIREFYIAKSIEEEIRGKVPSSAVQDGKLEIPRDLLINQRLLTNGASNAIVLLLLRDAVNDKRLTTEQLMKLVELSREKGGVEQESNFAVAAANAITVLNAAGYDFSHQDLSNVSILGANLSYGMFEGTNFRNANLQGADFTEAWLKNANLGGVQLANIEFCETLEPRFRNEQIFNIAYSFDGKYLAVDVGAQTVIFENVKNDFKEIRRVPGCFFDSKSCPFSNDGNQILTSIGQSSLPQKEGPEEDEEDYYYDDEEEEEDSWGAVDGMNEGGEEIEVERKSSELRKRTRKEILLVSVSGMLHPEIV